MEVLFSHNASKFLCPKPKYHKSHLLLDPHKKKGNKKEKHSFQVDSRIGKKRIHDEPKSHSKEVKLKLLGPETLEIGFYNYPLSVKYTERKQMRREKVKGLWKSEKLEYQPCFNYLPSTRLLVISDIISGLLEEEAVLELPLLVRNAGCLGAGHIAVSLSSMVITFDMEWRSLGSSCTHKSPTLTHLINWLSLQLSSRVLSIKSSTLFSVQSLHAWENGKIQKLCIGFDGV